MARNNLLFNELFKGQNIPNNLIVWDVLTFKERGDLVFIIPNQG